MAQSDQYSVFDPSEEGGTSPDDRLKRSLMMFNPMGAMKSAPQGSGGNNSGGTGGNPGSAPAGPLDSGPGSSPSSFTGPNGPNPTSGLPGSTPLTGPGPVTPGGGFANTTSGLQSNIGAFANNTFGTENTLLNNNSGILDFLGGPPQDSPLYSALLSQSRSAIGNSYDSAVANTRASAESRGFGYEQPIEQGAEAGVRAQEAGALSAAPATALQETIAPELQAAGITAGEAAALGQQTSSSLGDITSLQTSRNSEQASLLNSLSQLIQGLLSSSSSAYGAYQTANAGGAQIPVLF